MRPPFTQYANGRRRPPLPYRPPTPPRFDFLSPTDADGLVIPEPWEVAAFKRIGIDDPEGLRLTLNAMRRHPKGKEVKNTKFPAYVGIVTSLVVSPYWDNERLVFDPTSREEYLNDTVTKTIIRQELPGITIDSDAHMATKLELRIIQLAIYTTRAAAAAEPSYGLPMQQAA